MIQLLNQYLRCQERPEWRLALPFSVSAPRLRYRNFSPASMSQFAGLQVSSYPGFWHLSSIPGILFHGFLSAACRTARFLLSLIHSHFYPSTSSICSTPSLIIRRYRQIRPPLFGGLRWDVKVFPESLVLPVSIYIPDTALTAFTDSCWRLSMSAGCLRLGTSRGRENTPRGHV